MSEYVTLCALFFFLFFSRFNSILTSSSFPPVATASSMRQDLFLVGSLPTVFSGQWIAVFFSSSAPKLWATCPLIGCESTGRRDETAPSRAPSLQTRCASCHGTVARLWNNGKRGSQPNKWEDASCKASTTGTGWGLNTRNL